MAITGKKAYAAATTYTDEALKEVGALRGKPCTIKSTEHKDGRNKVVFEWTANDGTTRETTIYIYDGTPIYVWEGDGTTYQYGDIVIYSSAFYRCVYENSDTVFDNSHWAEIGSSDGNYDIVPNKDYLPSRFTQADKKMFYAYEEECFYFWDGYSWKKRLDIGKKQEILTPKSGIIIEKNEETNETEISAVCIEKEDVKEMWKDSGILELSSQTVSVAVGSDSTITVVKHSGTVSVESEDDSISSVSVSGDLITIHGVSVGDTSIIVISASSDDNRKIEKTINVSVT